MRSQIEDRLSVWLMIAKLIARWLSAFIERLQRIIRREKLILIIIIFDETFHFSHRSRAHLRGEKRYAQGSIKTMFDGGEGKMSLKYLEMYRKCNK